MDLGNELTFFIFINQMELILNKSAIKYNIINLLKDEKEIERIIIFGSFNKSEEPNDLDIAIVQNSPNNYLDLSLKYRKLLRKVSKEIALDVIPLKPDYDDNFFINEIESGEVIYAKGN